MSATPLPAGGTAQAQTGSYNAAAADGSTAIVAVFHAAAPRDVDPAEVAAAAALIDALPTAAPPPQPKGLPQPHFMPWRRNQSFVGREPDLLTLARQIKEGGTAAVGQSPAVSGMGGQGKTQLAVEFAYRYGSWFRGGVFWLNCADPATVAEAVAACGPALYPAEPGFSARPLPERVALVASAWGGELPRLLIFDNCEDEGILDDWMPKGGGCRVLVTARRLAWSPDRGIASLPLGSLTSDESLALLHRHRPDLPADDTGLAALAEELGHLPLALELAGRALARYRHDPSGSPDAYLAELRDADVLDHASLSITDPETPDHSRLPTHHEKDVARTFEVSLRRLDPGRPVDALARDVFAGAAWLSPGVPIPRHLLKLCAGVADDHVEANHRFSDALGRLTELALVEKADRGSVTVHRLLAAFARARMAQAGAARLAVEAAVAAEADRLLVQNDPTPFQGWGAHLSALALAASRSGTRSAIDLLNAAGFYNMFIADFASAEAMLQDAATRAEKLHGIAHPEVARTLGNLAILQRRYGKLAAAQANQLRTLAAYEQEFGCDHLRVAIALTNLVNLQSEPDQLEIAEANQIRALGIFETVYGSDHLEMALPLGNLGVIQRRRGDLGSAEKNLTKSLRIFETCYGQDHPEVGRTLANLGVLHHERGDLAASTADFDRSLRIQEKIYGPHHPDVADTLVSFSKVQIDDGRDSDAEVSLTRALAIFETTYGPDHPEADRVSHMLNGVRERRGRASSSALKRRPK